ncbi:MAG: orotate phosphoribosyltransferase, partial [Gemmataceae bacterium]
VIDAACRLIQQDGLAGPTTVIAGGETAGIPYAAWIAQQLDRPMIYVRKQPKGFGRLAQIEGELAPGTDVLLIEDLLFDAKSKIHFAQALRTAGAVVGHTLVVFDYGNAKSRAALQTERLTPHALTNWPTLLPLAQEVGYLTAEQAGIVREFLQDPAAWSARRSGM